MSPPFIVENFENLNPANTLWGKQYSLYSKIDTKPKRFLDFEKWWWGYFFLNKEEIEWIVQNLFVGDKLAANEVRTADGKTTVNLRNIHSPIVVFASWGDNITPPQQALNWIPDLYDSVEGLRAHEQTIVYCPHEKIGHLGIFVSTKAADERPFNLVRQFIQEMPVEKRPTLAQLKEAVKRQSFILLLDEERAVKALPKLLPDVEERQRGLARARQIATARAGKLSAAQEARFRRLEEVLGVAAANE